MSILSKTLSHGSNNLLTKPAPVLDLEAITEDPDLEKPQNVQVFTSNVTFSFNNNASLINQRVSALFARLQSHDPTLSILPISTAKHLNPIVSSVNVPSDQDAFANFFSGFSQNSKTTQFHATVVSSMRINQLKHTNGTFEYLRKYGIYLKYNQIDSTQVRSVGWLFEQHPEAESRNELKSILVEMMGGFTNFQLNARDVTMSRGSALRTRGWVLEMDQTDADERMDKILEKCHLGARITLVPFMDPRAWDTGGALETFFIKQNQMLNDTQVINVNGLKGLDEFTTDEQERMSTIREAFLKTEVNGVPIFRSVSQVNSKRVCFLTLQKHYHDACHVIDDFIASFVPNLDKDERPKFLFMDNDPIRVGKRNIPATISTYTEHLKDFVLELDDETRQSLLLPPGRRIRGQRSYKEVAQTTVGTNANQTLDITSTTSTSSKTSMGSTMTDFEAKLQSAMDHLNKLQNKIESNQATLQIQATSSEERMRKMEESVLKSFESINHLAASQTVLQTSMQETNSRLEVLSELLSTLITNQDACKEPVSPTRKIARKKSVPAETEPPGEHSMEVEST